MYVLDSVVCGDSYTAAATIQDVIKSNGGFFQVVDQDVYAQLQYGAQGLSTWTQDIHLPIGVGTLAAGTTGIKFKNYVAGANGTISAALSLPTEPPIQIGAGGNPTVNPGSAKVILAGTGSAAVGATSITTQAVVFSTAFASAPIVVVGLGSVGSDSGRAVLQEVAAVNVTAAGFDLKLINNLGSGQTVVGNWVATLAA